MKDIDIKLNMKSLLLFEQFTDRSFYSIGEDDMMMLMYCVLIANNDNIMTYSQFQLMMNNKKIARTLFNKCRDELDFMAQFEKKMDKATNEGSGEMVKVTDIITSLIVNGIDINYVMNELRLWELPAIIHTIEERTKQDMTDKRFWTYMQILPHIDSKKVKSPEKLIPFPWETENKKQDNIKFMEENKDKIMAFFNKNKKEE